MYMMCRVKCSLSPSASLCRDKICSSGNIHIYPKGDNWKILRGGEGGKKENIRVNGNFQRGWEESFNQKAFHWRAMDIFWNNTLPVLVICSCCSVVNQTFKIKFGIWI